MEDDVIVMGNEKKALFLESDVPPGGVCLSSFVAVTSDGRLLTGKMAKPEIWIERFFVGENHAPRIAESGKYIMPASHLKWYESPLEAAERVLREQLRMEVPAGKLKLIDVQSHLSGDPKNQSEPSHWDICFVYQFPVAKSSERKYSGPEWFAELEFRPVRSLPAENFARGHGDVLDLARKKLLVPRATRRKKVAAGKKRKTRR
jgi:ADP-ribose pyrophosphatase YjhB (NUDIX family)